MSPILVVSQLQYQYPDLLALDALTFTIESPQIVALVGPNGSGKSTLLRCLAVLDPAYSGQITILGTNVRDNPRECQKFISYLSDEAGLYDELTVQQSIVHRRMMFNLDSQEANSYLNETFEEFNLNEILSSRVGNLSKGQRQKLGIILAAMVRPRLLLLDEPAAGLDPEARLKLSSVLKKICHQGTTILISSHILAELEDYSERMLTLSQGRLIGDVLLSNHEKVKIQTLFIHSSAELSEIEPVLNEHLSVLSWEQLDGRFVLQFSGDKKEREEFLSLLIGKNFGVSQFFIEKKSLQRVYLSQMGEMK